MTARSIQQMCQPIDAASPHEQFVVCPSCGQIFDCRRHTLVRYHRTETHAALDPSAR